MKTVRRAGIVVAVLSVFILSAFSDPVQMGGSVKGRVSPADAALNACAISGTDTIKTNVIGGMFEIKELKAGTYSILIEAAVPFKTVTKSGIEVKEGEATDIGEIRLDQ